MNFTIPTVEDITNKYTAFEANQEDPRAELSKLTKDELIERVIELSRNKRTDTVQELAKAILSDEEFLAADYETIASAIRTIKPEAKTSAKSIASYVSKKREEWNLPPRIRIQKPRTNSVA